jgi:hypothetical protein
MAVTVRGAVSLHRAGLARSQGAQLRLLSDPPNNPPPQPVSVAALRTGSFHPRPIPGPGHMRSHTHQTVGVGQTSLPSYDSCRSSCVTWSRAPGQAQVWRSRTLAVRWLSSSRGAALCSHSGRAISIPSACSLSILHLQPPLCWNYKCAPPLATVWCFIHGFIIWSENSK